MKRLAALDLAFLLLLGSLPLLSAGTTAESSGLWGFGLAVVMTGFLIPLVLRFSSAKEKAEDEPDVCESPC